MAPAGSKMFVVGHRFLNLLVDIYNMTPTGWPVDYVNQVLVGSQLMRVQSPFLDGHLLPRYRHRTHHWSVDERDSKAVELASAYVVEFSVARTARENYMPERGGCLHVLLGISVCWRPFKLLMEL